MSGMLQLSLNEVETMACEALERAGATPTAAASMARSTRLAERDGIRSHGLLYVPIYAEHLRCGKVDGEAVPEVERTRAAAMRVDAANGFAHPAIDAGWDTFTEAARECGIGAMSLHNSYNCGVLGHHAERLAVDGLIGLCFTHAPASIAPVGGTKPVIGTNPFAFAVPDAKGAAKLVIDQSASVIAKSEILLRRQTGESIEPHWALDADGNPTMDADKALSGSMRPTGGYKGFGLGLTVEILAAALSGAKLSTQASPFSGKVGGPPSTGQFFIAIDPDAFAGAAFAPSLEHLCASIEEQDGARLPGARRVAHRKTIEVDGVAVEEALLQRIRDA
tara:strand:+ start:2068 stop:3072 length:1005 start_codon:yes stop_codon:yes gene_type:complete